MTVIDLQVLGPAFIAGLLVLATHVPLGTIVLERGIIFIEIALAQVAATGVVFGGLMWGEVSGWIIQASAIVAALACSVMLVWTDKRFPEMQEAIIGVLYVTAAAVQLMMLSVNPAGSEYLKQLLIGQILWVSPMQLAGIALVYAGVLALWHFRDLRRERMIFYGVFAVVITISVQIVGVLLVFASLIVPALAARAAAGRWRILIALNVGVAGYFLGLVASALFNLPTGAAIVCALVMMAIIVGLALSRQKPAEEAQLPPEAVPGE
ncbi:MAG: metal ABC transporter permease [Alphaproteobacteria bacterium]|nr:metal ABC transporter permease [Alphaproteobacteria bacterium]